ncbi:MAG: hypothetical protein ACRETF_09985 [Nevskiaceae bacterium]
MGLTGGTNVFRYTIWLLVAPAWVVGEVIAKSYLDIAEGLPDFMHGRAPVLVVACAVGVVLNFLECIYVWDRLLYSRDTPGMLRATLGGKTLTDHSTGKQSVGPVSVGLVAGFGGVAAYNFSALATLLS